MLRSWKAAFPPPGAFWELCWGWPSWESALPDGTRGKQALVPKPSLLTRPPLLFGHQLLDFPLFFLLLYFSFLVNLLDGLWALICPPGHPVALEGRRRRRKARSRGKLRERRLFSLRHGHRRGDHTLESIPRNSQAQESQRAETPLPPGLEPHRPPSSPKEEEEGRRGRIRSHLRPLTSADTYLPKVNDILQHEPNA